MPRLRAGIAVVLAFIVVSGAMTLAQRFGVFEGAGAGIRTPPKDFSDGRFTVCKWMFRSDRSDDQLFECPMLIGSDVGTAALSNTEVQRLREYRCPASSRGAAPAAIRGSVGATAPMQISAPSPMATGASWWR